MGDLSRHCWIWDLLIEQLTTIQLRPLRLPRGCGDGSSILYRTRCQSRQIHLPATSTKFHNHNYSPTSLTHLAASRSSTPSSGSASLSHSLCNQLHSCSSQTSRNGNTHYYLYSFVNRIQAFSLLCLIALQFFRIVMVASNQLRSTCSFFDIDQCIGAVAPKSSKTVTRHNPFRRTKYFASWSQRSTNSTPTLTHTLNYECSRSRRWGIGQLNCVRMWSGLKRCSEALKVGKARAWLSNRNSTPSKKLVNKMKCQGSSNARVNNDCTFINFLFLFSFHSMINTYHSL